MPRRTKLSPAAPWIRLESTQADWQKASPGLLGTMLTQLHLIRAFEEQVLQLVTEGLVHGPAHSSNGQEGGAVGSILPLTALDKVNGSHRGHHQFIAKLLGHLAPEGLDPLAEVSAPVEDSLYRTLAEILGLAEGYCKGRGGSMHLQHLEAGALGTNAIVGGGVPMAAGCAMAHKRAGDGGVVVSYFGDGALNIGSVLETMNLASAWDLPLCFFVENNQYAVSTHVSEVVKDTRLSARGLGFSIPSWQVDGMDPLAVWLATTEAVAHMRAGKGPTLIEAEVYRFFHQNGPAPGSAFGYRPKEEEAAWRDRDPLTLVARRMQDRDLIDEPQVKDLRARAQALMSRVADRLLEPQGNQRRIRPALWPSHSFRDQGLRGDLSELDGQRCLEQEAHPGPLHQQSFIAVVAQTLDRRMAADPRILTLGEDIHRLKGGTNGATRGLAEKYGDRVLGTPISENAFMGLAGGLALDGRHRPVVEFMYPDFMWVAADQVFNQVGKARHMFGGDRAMPLVLRTKVAMGTGYGSQHSMDPAGLFATAPGWRIVAPSTPYDYVGLMNAALACQDPVLVLEHVDLYATQGMAPEDDSDFIIPLGRAKVRRSGTQATALTYLSLVQPTIDAAAALGLDLEVIDLRSLDRASLDWETVGASIRKTNAVIVIEQGAQGTAYGPWLADEIQRRYFDWLDQPVARVCGGEASPSVSKVLERAAIALQPEIESGLKQVMAAMGCPG